MFYYICARCHHITKQKIEMKRHLDKIKKCNIKDNNNGLTEQELYDISLQKQDKLSEKKNTDIIKKENTEFHCDKCNKSFSNKGNLNKHLKIVCNDENKITNTTNNIQHIGVQNITNKIININLGMLKGFDQDWDTTKIDHNKKSEILLSNSKFTKTLENILKNELNLNVIMNDDDDKAGIVYNNEKNQYEPMTKKDIIEKSMEKVYNHLKQFYNEIVNNNKHDLSVSSLENELKVLETKYKNFFKFEDAQKIVNNTFSKLYNDKKEEAENIYYDFIRNNSHLIEEY